MLGVMIKNNLKLMLRSKWILALVIVGPVVVIAALSSAFHSVMSTMEKKKPFAAGYSISENSPYRPYLDAMQKISEQQEITLVQYQQEEADDIIASNQAEVFVEFTDNSYTVYSKDQTSTESAMIKYILFQLFHSQDKEVNIQEQDQEFIKIPSSIEYYGKIELIYFLWCSMITLASVIASERKNNIQQRLKISPASNVTLYLAKWVPCFLSITIMIGIAGVLSTFIFDLHWGNLLAVLGMLVLGAAAVSSFGILLFYLIQNVAVTFGLEFAIIMYMGFVGGSFESYMYSPAPEFLRCTSPIYFMNRCLVEYETNGRSDYTAGAVWMHLGILIVFGFFGCLLMKRRMEVR